jgi:hypothetical protein
MLLTRCLPTPILLYRMFLCCVLCFVSVLCFMLCFYVVVFALFLCCGFCFVSMLWFLLCFCGVFFALFLCCVFCFVSVLCFLLCFCVVVFALFLCCVFCFVSMLCFLLCFCVLCYIFPVSVVWLFWISPSAFSNVYDVKHASFMLNTFNFQTITKGETIQQTTIKKIWHCVLSVSDFLINCLLAGLSMGYWMEAILMKLKYLLFAMNEAISPQWQQKKEKTTVNESETLLSYNGLNIIASYTSNDITVSTQDHRQVKQHNNTELKVRDHPRLCHYH